MIINSANLLYFIINKLNECIEESNGNKYLMLVPNVDSKETLKQYGKLGNKSKDLDQQILIDSAFKTGKAYYL